MEKIQNKNISLAQGDNKYILVKDNTGKLNVVSKDLSWHAEIYDSLSKKGTVLGGGRINFDPTTKNIKIYGSSGSYGTANHDLVKKVLLTELSNYEIITGNEIKKKQDNQDNENLKYVDSTWLKKLTSKLTSEKTIKTLNEAGLDYLAKETASEFLRELIDERKALMSTKNEYLSSAAKRQDEKIKYNISRITNFVNDYDLFNEEIIDDVLEHVKTVTKTERGKYLNLKDLNSLENMVNGMSDSSLDDATIKKFVNETLEDYIHYEDNFHCKGIILDEVKFKATEIVIKYGSQKLKQRFAELLVDNDNEYLTKKIIQQLPPNQIYEKGKERLKDLLTNYTKKGVDGKITLNYDEAQKKLENILKSYNVQKNDLDEDYVVNTFTSHVANAANFDFNVNIDYVLKKLEIGEFISSEFEIDEESKKQVAKQGLGHIFMHKNPEIYKNKNFATIIKKYTDLGELSEKELGDTFKESFHEVKEYCQEYKTSLDSYLMSINRKGLIPRGTTQQIAQEFIEEYTKSIDIHVSNDSWTSSEKIILMNEELGGIDFTKNQVHRIEKYFDSVSDTSLNPKLKFNLAKTINDNERMSLATPDYFRELIKQNYEGPILNELKEYISEDKVYNIAEEEYANHLETIKKYEQDSLKCVDYRVSDYKLSIANKLKEMAFLSKKYGVGRDYKRLAREAIDIRLNFGNFMSDSKKWAYCLAKGLNLPEKRLLES